MEWLLGYAGFMTAWAWFCWLRMWMALSKVALLEKELEQRKKVDASRKRLPYTTPTLVPLDQRKYQTTDPRYEAMEELRRKVAETNWRWCGLRCKACGKAAMEQLARIEGERKAWLSLIPRKAGDCCVDPNCSGKLYATMEVG